MNTTFFAPWVYRCFGILCWIYFLIEFVLWRLFHKLNFSIAISIATAQDNGWSVQTGRIIGYVFWLMFAGIGILFFFIADDVGKKNKVNAQGH